MPFETFSNSTQKVDQTLPKPSDLFKQLQIPQKFRVNIAKFCVKNFGRVVRMLRVKQRPKTRNTNKQKELIVSDSTGDTDDVPPIRTAQRRRNKGVGVARGRDYVLSFLKGVNGFLKTMARRLRPWCTLALLHWLVVDKHANHRNNRKSLQQNSASSC